MKKRLVLSFAAIFCVLFGANVVMAKEGPEGNPFVMIWKAIENLQHQITDISLQPGPQGIQGEPGPIGPQGESAKQGAGNIAFIAADRSGSNYIYILTNEGQVFYKFIYDSTWSREPATDPTIPVSDIVQWDHGRLLDINGNVWGYTGTYGWTNMGHP